jgi:hypothetical protein
MNCKSPNASKQEETPSGCINSKSGLTARSVEIALETAPLMNNGRISKELMDETLRRRNGVAEMSRALQQINQRTRGLDAKDGPGGSVNIKNPVTT